MVGWRSDGWSIVACRQYVESVVVVGSATRAWSENEPVVRAKSGCRPSPPPRPLREGEGRPPERMETKEPVVEPKSFIPPGVPPMVVCGRVRSISRTSDANWLAGAPPMLLGSAYCGPGEKCPRSSSLKAREW